MVGSIFESESLMFEEPSLKAPSSAQFFGSSNSSSNCFITQQSANCSGHVMSSSGSVDSTDCLFWDAVALWSQGLRKAKVSVTNES